jgi:ketopantoate reductase
MRILIVGAGVIGTVYGAKLLERGHEVVVLARGDRLIELQRHGLILEDAERGHRTVLPVSVVDGVTAGDRYDLVLAPAPASATSSAHHSASAFCLDSRPLAEPTTGKSSDTS